ncbi:hypothetical protein ASPBRDRAFT_320255 [Aspergillus brasiliensis CBS 101740]|uniref:Uncharacterized protein n=1 Tax=Aspergillus brasiliensis (strain CBS 101740 / IMI 381727 / IBT 21946) TaxID=767769 RepID=A0A1L9U978_ASPBC|nr:hypothetical protein ASPBRDRAFT_320255 [Aspergillus brasiliensis CBS 101740]
MSITRFALGVICLSLHVTLAVGFWTALYGSDGFLRGRRCDHSHQYGQIHLACFVYLTWFAAITLKEKKNSYYLKALLSGTPVGHQFLVSETLGPRYCSAHSNDRMPETLSLLKLSTNISCGFAWLDAPSSDTQYLVLGMLGWVLIRPRGFPLTLSGSKRQISCWHGGVLYEQVKDRRPKTTRPCCSLSLRAYYCTPY